MIAIQPNVIEMNYNYHTSVCSRILYYTCLIQSCTTLYYTCVVQCMYSAKEKIIELPSAEIKPNDLKKALWNNLHFARTLARVSKHLSMFSGKERAYHSRRARDLPFTSSHEHIASI